ncbi:hypothetical protein DFP72DRAFT_1064899 [Ephemerocybe angulata]|uniref:Uncharacterized protein n=1 Tax=Ephemerocybe angulata TaxID=980116 RepID=A0A8H6I3D8_9AGAR|nr:hypothetical protein DFP72DRAFT_1064899 [Tulosesus angulatus]
MKLEASSQEGHPVIEVKGPTNPVVKSVKPPLQTNQFFYGGTACLNLISTARSCCTTISNG